MKKISHKNRKALTRFKKRLVKIANMLINDKIATRKNNSVIIRELIDFHRSEMRNGKNTLP